MAEDKIPVAFRITLGKARRGYHLIIEEGENGKSEKKPIGKGEDVLNVLQFFVNNTFFEYKGGHTPPTGLIHYDAKDLYVKPSGMYPDIRRGAEIAYRIHKILRGLVYTTNCAYIDLYWLKKDKEKLQNQKKEISGLVEKLQQETSKIVEDNKRPYRK